MRITLFLTLFIPFLTKAQTFNYLTKYTPASGELGFAFTANIQVTQTSSNNGNINYSVRLADLTIDASGYWLYGTFYNCIEYPEICKGVTDKDFYIAQASLINNCSPKGFGLIDFYNEHEVVEGIAAHTTQSCKPSFPSGVKLKVQTSAKQNERISIYISQMKAGKNGSKTNTPSLNATSSSSSSAKTSTTSTSTSSAYPASNTDVLTQQRDEAIINLAATSINTVGYLLDEARENRERKEAQQQRAYEKATKKNNLLAENVQKTARNTFQEMIDNYARGTKNTQSKLNLVFAHNLIESNYYYYSQDARKRNYVSVRWLLPEWEQEKNWTQTWIEEAVLKGNADAMLYKYGKEVTSKESVGKLEALAEKGSKDAMIILGRYYNQKKRLYVLDGLQGNDANKALYWFTKAANSGCPMGLYYLGMIYKYGYLPFDKMYNDDERNLKYVKYSVVKDQKKAFEYFSKAAELAHYDPSSYAKFESLDGYLKKKNAWPDPELDYGSSYFHPGTLTELAAFYEEGKVVPRNESKAHEYTRQARALTNANFSEDFTEYIKYAFRYHNAEWPEVNNEKARCYNTDSLPSKYVIESRKRGNYSTTVPILDPTEDFYISFKVTKVNWPNTSAYGIVLGEDLKSKNHFSLNITGSEYVFADKGISYTEIQKANIDQRSGRIGAGLRENEHFLEITSLQPGYPAMNSNQIAIGDVILKIAQGNDEPVDMTGRSVAEALEKIKGKEGTEVRLTIKKNDGAIKVVSLIRKASPTTDWSILKKGNKLSIDIGGQTVLRDKEIKELYGKGFGFMIYSEANPTRMEIEDFRFHIIY